MAYEFSLDRKATVTLSASLLVLIILVFVAGILTGVAWQSNQDLIAFQKLPARAPKASAVMQPPAFTQAAAATPSTRAAAVAATPAPAPTPPASPGAMPGTMPSPGPPEPLAAEPAATATSAAAPQSPQMAASGTVPAVPNLQLAVQVGAFLERANADKLAAQLKEAGYSPQIVQDGHAPKQWNFVRVGPYHDWDEAAEIASVLSRDLPSPAVVRPMR
jgi:cell division protein FtsN